MREAFEVSIVMPCLNEAETLVRCIEKAQRGLQSAGIRGEIVVADNGSTKRHTNDNYALMNAVLPVVRPFERLVPSPFGMSVIGIFRKD